MLFLPLVMPFPAAAETMVTSYYRAKAPHIAAHRTLPIGTRLLVTNPRNGRSARVVIGDRGTALGKSPEEHDLSLLEGGLRSHGGLAEQAVLFTLNRSLKAASRQPLTTGLRNFDIFDFALNGVESGV